MIKIDIRPEDKRDASAIKFLLQDIFGGDTESALVERIRKSDNYIPELGLIASINDELIGFILLSEIKICSTNVRKTSLVLSPLAVHKSYQNRGVGTQLMLAALEKASLLGYTSIIVLGHHDYYLRFGFEAATTWEIEAPFNINSDDFMGIELVPKGLSNFSGMVEYPESWKA